MNTLLKTMDMLYNNNIKLYAAKNKIQIKSPHWENEMNEMNDIITSPIIGQPPDTESENKYSDEYMYRKPWTKLNIIHKIIKMKEFINNLNTTDIQIKNKLNVQLTALLKEKKLTKKNDINYDMINGVIVSIPILEYINGTYIIN